FDFASVARNQACLRQGWLERGIVVDERARDAVPNSTGLARFTAAANVDFEIKRFEVVGKSERLTHNHASGFAGEEFVDGLAVDDDLARAFLEEHARHGSFAAAGSVVPVTDHARLLEGTADSISSG